MTDFLPLKEFFSTCLSAACRWSCSPKRVFGEMCSLMHLSSKRSIWEPGLWGPSSTALQLSDTLSYSRKESYGNIIQEVLDRALVNGMTFDLTFDLVDRCSELLICRVSTLRRILQMC